MIKKWNFCQNYLEFSKQTNLIGSEKQKTEQSSCLPGFEYTQRRT